MSYRLTPKDLPRDGGRALPPALRHFFETAYRADLAPVRVHESLTVLRAGAHAVTLGDNLYFAPGCYRPDTEEGFWLIGHELAHVLQQREGRVTAPHGDAFIDDAALEAEADALATAALRHPGYALRRPIGPLTTMGPYPAVIQPFWERLDDGQTVWRDNALWRNYWYEYVTWTWPPFCLPRGVYRRRTTHILLSFGGIDGGFEFTWQLRNDLMQHYNRNPFQTGSVDAFFVYLDAVSLMGRHGSLYNWDSKIYCYKFSNKDWKEYYDAATEQCRYMVFVLTKPWFDSQWCWGEYDVFRKNSNAKPIFIVFPDGQAILDQGGTYNDRINEGHDVDALKQYIGENTAIAITSPPIPEIATVSIDGTDYKYHYKYACNSGERKLIMECFKPL